MSATSKLAGVAMAAILEFSVLFPVDPVEVLARIIAKASEVPARGKCNTVEPKLDRRRRGGQQDRQFLYHAIEVGCGEPHAGPKPQSEKIALRAQAVEFHRPAEHSRSGCLGQTVER